MKYLVKVYQYKKGSTCKPRKQKDVFIQGYKVGDNETCTAKSISDAPVERSKEFLVDFFTSPLGLSETSLRGLQSDTEAFVNSGATGVFWQEAFTKKGKRLEVYVEAN